MPKVLILNGPNLNLLGRREPDIYGSTILDDLEPTLQANIPEGMHLGFFQTNHEGEMIERIHDFTFRSGGRTHRAHARDHS